VELRDCIPIFEAFNVMHLGVSWQVFFFGIFSDSVLYLDLLHSRSCCGSIEFCFNMDLGDNSSFSLNILD
jgi:hypothetical protein